MFGPSPSARRSSGNHDLLSPAIEAQLYKLKESVLKLEQDGRRREEEHQKMRRDLGSTRTALQAERNEVATLTATICSGAAASDSVVSAQHAVLRDTDLRLALQANAEEVATLRAHAEGVAATVERIEGAQRETTLLKQEVGVLRAEQVQLQHSLRKADAAAVQQAAALALVAREHKALETKVAALTASSAEIARVARGAAEGERALRETLTRLGPESKEAAEAVVSAWRGGEATRALEWQVSRDGLVHQLEGAAERMDRAERAARQAQERQSERERVAAREAETAAAEVARLNALVEELRRVTASWATGFAKETASWEAARLNEPHSSPDSEPRLAAPYLAAPDLAAPYLAASPPPRYKPQGSVPPASAPPPDASHQASFEGSEPPPSPPSSRVAVDAERMRGFRAAMRLAERAESVASGRSPGCSLARLSGALASPASSAARPSPAAVLSHLLSNVSSAAPDPKALVTRGRAPGASASRASELSSSPRPRHQETW